VRLALVVQRYGEEVAGGAEAHARQVAALLARRHQVTVLTTNARDYLSWEPHFAAGRSEVGGIEVLRFPVERARSPEAFARAAARAFAPGHSPEDERRYLEEQGPWAPALWEHLRAEGARYDALVAFTYRYVTTYEAARAMGRRTLLVPTAEKDPAVELGLSCELFRAVGAIAYNSPEERALIEAASGNREVPGEVVGVHCRIPAPPDPKRARDRHRLERPYAIYVGRIDRNKGCPELFDFFTAFLAETAAPHELVLVGEPVLALPRHPRVRHLGFLEDGDKLDALAGADLLLLPSPYESLSMVTLEAMALGVPVLVNGRCEVLKGQVRRSNGGLYYESYDEFVEALTLLLREPRLRALLGRKGRAYYRETYAPEVIAAKYERLLARLG
jgi:glycosyltransferase involved in cell wall biosynthesis